MILSEAHHADKIVVAWGTHGTFMRRDRAVLDLLKDFDLYCMGTTNDGHPKHPLYLRSDTELELFRGAA